MDLLNMSEEDAHKYLDYVADVIADKVVERLKDAKD